MSENPFTRLKALEDKARGLSDDLCDAIDTLSKAGHDYSAEILEDALLDMGAVVRRIDRANMWSRSK